MVVLGWWFGCLCSGAWVWVWVLLYDVCIRASSWALLFGLAAVVLVYLVGGVGLL